MFLRRVGPLTGFLLILACGGEKKPDNRVVCLEGGPAVGRVGDCDIPKPSFRYAVMLSRGAGGQDRALHSLFEREILAQGALEAGDAPASASEVQQRIAAGEALLLGQRMSSPPWFEEGSFSMRGLKDWVGSLGLTMDEFVAEQRREMLAQRMRERVGGAAPDPVKVEAWRSKRCDELLGRGRISVVPEVSTDFQPCAPPPLAIDPGALNLE